MINGLPTSFCRWRSGLARGSTRVRRITCLDPVYYLCQPRNMSNRFAEKVQFSRLWDQGSAFDEVTEEGSAMTTGKKAAGSRKKPAAGRSAKTPGAARGAIKGKISASERWMLISRRVYNLAQKRGFVGGDLGEDLARAAREVDEEYETDVQGLLRLTDPTEMVQQFRELFVSYGLGQRTIDRLLELNRDALEKLARTNQRLIDSRTKKSARQAPRMQDAAGEAIRALQAFSRGLTRSNGINHQFEQPVETIKTLLAGLMTLASPKADSAVTSPAKAAGKAGQRAAGAEFVRDATVKSYHGLTPAELAEAPVSALRGLSREKGRQLEEAFHFDCIRDMAAWRPVERAASIVVLADAAAEAGGGAGSGRRKSRAEVMQAAADGSVHRLDGVTRRQANVLRDAFNIHTVRDLAASRLFRVAKAIVALADTEEQD